MQFSDRLPAAGQIQRHGTRCKMRNGILLEKGYGCQEISGTARLNDPNTIFQIASVTKQFTAITILKLVELKKLALNDELSKFYPDFPKGDSITIENLLTHTSGITDHFNDSDLKGFRSGHRRNHSILGKKIRTGL